MAAIQRITLSVPLWPLLALLLLALCGPVTAQPGLVDWVAKEAAPGPQAALRVLGSRPGGLEVRWRTMGAGEWEGDLAGWEASREGLVDGRTGDGLFTASLKASSWHGGLRLKLMLTAARATAEVGFHLLQQSCADFGNDAYRAWYESRIKACLDHYQPAGIAWDMGWGAGPTWGYSRATPRTPNGDGMLRAQADLWKWLPAHHPEMRAIANEAFGTPSQMFADGILIEGGFAVGKTELDYEAAKALGTTIISYEYPAQYAARLVGLPTESARYVQLRYRAVGLNTASGRYVVYPSQEIVGKEGPAVAYSDLQADGDWHVATFDMRKLPNIAEVRGLAFGMEAGADEAHLWVDYIRFSATPDGPALPVGRGSFPSSITATDVAAFEPRPGWLGNPAAEYGVRRDQGVLDFLIRGAGRGMSWSFFPATADLAQEYLKVLSLGACLGAGLRAEWETLNAFSAQAMALPPLVGSHDVEVTSESSGVTAAGWGGGGRLLLAAYNGSSEPRSASVEISAKAVAQAGVSPGRGALSRILGRDALPSRPGPAASVARAGALKLSVRLDPGEALLWGSWGWE